MTSGQTCQERTVETIPGAGGVDRIDRKSGNRRSSIAVRDQRAIAAQLQDHGPRALPMAPIDERRGSSSPETRRTSSRLGRK